MLEKICGMRVKNTYKGPAALLADTKLLVANREVPHNKRWPVIGSMIKSVHTPRVR